MAAAAASPCSCSSKCATFVYFAGLTIWYLIFNLSTCLSRWLSAWGSDGDAAVVSRTAEVTSRPRGLWQTGSNRYSVTGHKQRPRPLDTHTLTHINRQTDRGDTDRPCRHRWCCLSSVNPGAEVHSCEPPRRSPPDKPRRVYSFHVSSLCRYSGKIMDHNVSFTVSARLEWIICHWNRNSKVLSCFHLSTRHCFCLFAASWSLCYSNMR